MTHPTDTAKSEELKACPWGHEGIVKLEEPNHGRKGYCVCCFVCGSSPGAFDTPAEAIAAWNRRSSPPQNDAGVEGLRERCRGLSKMLGNILGGGSEWFSSVGDEYYIDPKLAGPELQRRKTDAAITKRALFRANKDRPLSELQALGQEFEAGEKECLLSPDGKHQVDTSMESGPNNCFHCEQPMPKTGARR